MKTLSLFLFLVVTSPLFPQAPIILPDAPSPPPPPAPSPLSPTPLPADLLFVVRSEAPLIVLASPDGLVKVTMELGPIKIRGKFVDAPDKTQTKTFTEKNVYIVEAVATGRCELLIVPSGTTDVKNVVRRLLDCNVGPLPPPNPPNPPAPDAFTKSVQDAFAQETDPQKANQAAYLASVYKAAGALLDDTTITTVGGLFNKLSAVIHDSSVGIPKGSLAKVSKILGSDLNVVLGGTASGIDASKALPDKVTIKVAFTKYAAALDTLK